MTFTANAIAYDGHRSFPSANPAVKSLQDSGRDLRAKLFELFFLLGGEAPVFKFHGLRLEQSFNDTYHAGVNAKAVPRSRPLR